MKEKLLVGFLTGIFVLGGAIISSATVIDQSNLGSNTTGVLEQSVTWKQDIIAGMSGQLAGVDIFLTDDDNLSQPENVTAEIWMGASLLGSNIISWQDSGSHVRTTFDFLSDNILLSTGDLFSLAVTGGDSIWNFGLDLTGNNQYPGDLYAGSLLFPVYDMAFETHMVPVPEPSTFLLLGGGLVGLAFAVRRRRKE